MTSPRRKATYDDLRKVPEQFVAEIVDGELFTTPRPASPHARAGSAIGSVIFDRFDGPPGGDPGAPGGWWILFEPELHLGANVLVPDIAGWRRSRLPTFPKVAAFTVAPDWACEVRSPTTAGLDRERKMPIYAHEQVEHLWIVDALARTLEVYRSERGRWVVASRHGGSERIRAEPFDAIDLDISRWWTE